MTTLDLLTEPLVRLFLRIDAAQPSDPVLRAASEFWQLKRTGKIAPGESEMRGFPIELSPCVFHAQMMSNETKRWVASGAGHVARSMLQLTDGDKRIAVRLRRLFHIVAEKSEPYSAMFEIDGKTGLRQLVEVFAAPLGNGKKGTHMIFAAINSRTEAKQ
jgi:hypothetical protein